MMERPEHAAGQSGEGSETVAARTRVVQALRSLERGERDSMEGLRQALCQLVVVLRGVGRSSDEVIADVRGLVAQPVTAEGAAKVPPIAREALVELTLRWCADEYGRVDE